MNLLVGCLRAHTFVLNTVNKGVGVCNPWYVVCSVCNVHSWAAGGDEIIDRLSITAATIYCICVSRRGND